MCGIAGILTFDGAAPGSACLRKMASVLAHRGPDAEGYLEDVSAWPAVGLAHRRLSIIDLSPRASQPLGNEDGSVHVIVNGEIYNFRELRARLEGTHTFRSRSDSEVVVHGYEEKGDEVIAGLDGMFALALWDGKRRRLLLARDLFGKKPLYYWHDQRRFVFGSEIKALLAAGVPAELDEDCLAEYLAFGYVPTPRTLFRGIRKLPPASLMVVEGGGVGAPRRYWDLTFPRAGEHLRVGLDEAAQGVRERLTRAVAKRLVADVPVGVLLSGGVDSSAVAALAAGLGPERVRTFTVGFEGHSFYDERRHAQEVARHLGTEHHADVVRPQAMALVETLLEHHDEPFGDSSALPTYLVAQAARRHVTVALNGDGGDEAFAGYDRFQAALLAHRLPAPLRAGLALAARVLPTGGPPHRPLRRLRRFAEKAALPFEERLLAWSSFFDLAALREIDALGRFDPARVLSSYREALAGVREASLLSQLLYLNARTYLLDDLLPKMDRMTMAHGLEARSPLLDRELMEYAARLPDRLKRRGGQGKIVLKQAVKGLLPDSIRRRRKHGFGVPLGEWFRGELRPLVEQTLLGRSALRRRFRPGVLPALFADHLMGRVDRGHQLWSLLTLELWLQKHRLD